jgi:hypothetical protein
MLELNKGPVLLLPKLPLAPPGLVVLDNVVEDHGTV